MLTKCLLKTYVSGHKYDIAVYWEVYLGVIGTSSQLIINWTHKFPIYFAHNWDSTVSQWVFMIFPYKNWSLSAHIYWPNSSKIKSFLFTLKLVIFSFFPNEFPYNFPHKTNASSTTHYRLALTVHLLGEFTIFEQCFIFIKQWICTCYHFIRLHSMISTMQLWCW